MADIESILQLGIEAARVGDKAEARELFRLVTREKPDNAQGWLWLAGVAEDRQEKRTALEHVIALDPGNELARKGLAAMGVAAGAAATEAAPDAADTTATAGSTLDAHVSPTAADAPDAPDTTTPPPVTADAPEPATATTSDGVRTYDTPDTATTTNDDTWTPTFADDDFDLQDYEQTPRASDDEYQPGVAMDDEPEQRRGGLGWLPWVLGLIAIALVVYLAMGFFRDRDNVAETPGVTSGVTADAGTTVAGGVGGETGATATGGEGGLPIVGTTAAAGTTAAPVEQTAPPAGGEQAPVVTEAAPAEQPPAATEAAPAEQPAPAEGTPADQPTVIVVVPPEASVVPPVVEPTEAPPPTEVAPTEAPPAPPAQTGDLAAANPQPVPQGTLVQAGAWGFQYNGANNVSTGAFGGAAPSQGQYQIVVVNVANGTGEAATIPDGFFVLKDAQGRVYPFNRAASVDYVNRFGRGQAADIAADEQVAPTNTLVSVGLLFDIAPDATNLVLFSRDNVTEGFLVR